ncbi:hypothetical protein H112_02228 [Trichophyton rubrum D6]|nr:hypothetical protein H105_02245 [Trichophyton soudanense CBS 452.61]KDB36212.1 hypothetical protein H112_02228 [Trichophyton rubrum D6]
MHLRMDAGRRRFFNFRGLPAELRDEILFLVLFTKGRSSSILYRRAGNIHEPVYPDEHEPIDIQLTRTATHDSCALSILRTCRQLRDEAERVMYSNVTFGILFRHSITTFVDRLSTRQRRLVRRIQVELHSPSTYLWQVAPCEWRNVMDLVFRDCSSLRMLHFKLPNHPVERARLLQVFTIGRYQTTNVPLRLSGGIVFTLDDGKLLPNDDELARAITGQLGLASDSSQGSSAERPGQFPFLRLPIQVQRRILRYALIPPFQVIHPCLSPITDDTSLNVLPLLLTCKEIYRKAEAILYQEAVFTSCSPRYEKAMRRFLYNRTDRQLQLMRQFFCHSMDRWLDRRIDKFIRARSPDIEDLRRRIEKGEFKHPCLI